MKRQLPPYLYHDRGRLIYKRRTRDGWHRVVLESVSPEGKPLTDEALAEYLRIKRGPVYTPAGKTWRDLIKAYKAHGTYAEKAPRTRRDYDKALEYLDEKWGDLSAARVTRPAFHKLVDANRHRTKFARDLLAVSSILMGYAVDLGWRIDNPVKGMKRPQTPRDKRVERKPWPPHLIEAFRKEAPIGTTARTVFELCLGTGQRIGDVLRMRWADFDGQSVAIRQSKTGAKLHVPVTPALQSVLAQTTKNGIVIVATRRGPVSYRAAHHAVMAVRKAIGAEAYDIHALRWTAASELAEAGCSDELIQAVTGHSSLSMVAHYTQHVRQRVRAQEAQEKRK